MEEFLTVRDVSLHYINQIALQDVSVSLTRGSIHAFIGENGAGKSSLMKVIAGAVRPTSGSVFFRGQRIDKLGFYAVQKLGVRMMFQDVNLVPNMSVMDNLFLGNWIAPKSGLFKHVAIDKARQWEKTVETLQTLDFELDPATRVSELDIGQQKMVEIAKSILWESSVLILDEATAYLNDLETAKLFRVLRRVADMGHTVLMVSHKIEELIRLADAISVLREGRLIRTIPKESYEKESILLSMAVGGYLDRYPKIKLKKGSELLRLTDVGDGLRVHGIELTLRKREILGVFGLVGSGRSALADLITGNCPLRKGRIDIEGKAVKLANPRDAQHARIAYIPATTMDSLVPLMNAEQNITLSNLRSITSRGILEKHLEHEIAQDYAYRLGFDKIPLERSVRDLSGGTRQKVMLSKALLAHAKIFVFNEPTKGLDISSKVEAYNLINELVLENAGILLISSDINELLGMCDRLLILYRGQVVAELSAKEMTELQVLNYASGLR